MSDDHPDLEPIDLTSEAPTVPSPAIGTLGPAGPSGPPGGGWPEGWYADPWTAGQYRFWDGHAWTGDTHRSGPVTTSGWPATPAPSSYAQGARTDWAAPGGPVTPGFPPSRNPRGRRMGAIVAGLVVLVLLAGAIGYAIESHTETKHSAVNIVPPGETPTTAGQGQGGVPSPGAGAGAALSQIVVRQADVSASRIVLLIPDGNRTTKPTLDLCNGTFASEKQRVARLQVAEVSPTGDASLSTEAVTYRNAGATADAFAELRSVRAKCPNGPVTSPVGEGTATTKFNAAPDKSWPQVASVDRLAYSFDSTQAGSTTPSIAVYLRRGRVLLGVYFPTPTGVQPSVDGQTSIEGIVGVFAARLAKLPARDVN